ncbi:hypothetical protein [Geomicrobium sp. JCM 19055]|uniref:hypothetical protein n=1 Tax=Geomicrobium sp. JCM 19055 TaxID=1460649 RepID=UPI00045ED6D6|nr:hypothetical protein [Geomicrobium sp. JCM 19055]GAK00873.1 hypothetical protein JCM19055_3992 [Geomicrobium sp. JCM 19055]
MGKLTLENLEDIYFENEVQVNGVIYALVESGTWEDQGKFQTLDIIFTDGAEYYRGFVGRSGDHWQGYTYESEILGDEEVDLHTVEKREVTRTEWVEVG